MFISPSWGIAFFKRIGILEPPGPFYPHLLAAARSYLHCGLNALQIILAFSYLPTKKLNLFFYKPR